MDTSKEYIKMRLEAIPELGMGIPPNQLTHFISDNIFVDNKGDWYYSDEEQAVQLERQDQLQEMASDHKGVYKVTFGSILRDVYNYYFNDCPDGSLPHSMEQLWLAFVLKKEYNKIWNGESWIAV